MPEIWLNYGKNEVVLDIMAENLDEQIKFEQPVIDDSEINENLEIAYKEPYAETDIELQLSDVFKIIRPIKNRIWFNMAFSC